MATLPYQQTADQKVCIFLTVQEIKMANAEAKFPKLRGHYNKYLRHRNPYKFLSARRKNKYAKSRCKNAFESVRNEQANHKRQSSTSACTEFLDNQLAFSGENGTDLPFDANESGGNIICSYDNAFFQDPDDFYLEENQRSPKNGIDQDVCDAEYSESECELEESIYMFHPGFQNVSFQMFMKEDDSHSEYSSADETDSSEDSESESEYEVEHDPLLYSSSPITVSSSILMALAFVQKHKLTSEAFGDLLTIIEAHCPKPNNCKKTIKNLLAFLKKAKGDVVKHLFCAYCKAYAGIYEEDADYSNQNCKICSKELTFNSGFFVEVPLIKQLTNFFTGKQR